MKETKRTVASECDRLKKLFPNVDTITISFTGSGDSFEEFYNFETKPETGEEFDSEKIDDDFLFELLGKTDADFNNDGCRGEITIDIKNKKIEVTVDHYYTSTQPGQGVKLKSSDEI